MNSEIITIIFGVIALIFVFWIIRELTSSVKPMSKNEEKQYQKIKDISECQNPSSGFSFGKLLFFIFVILLILGAIFIASKGGFKFP